MPLSNEITMYFLFLLKTEEAEGAYGKGLLIDSVRGVHTQEFQGRHKLVLH